METSDKETVKRMREILTYYNLNIKDFAANLGISSANISRVLHYHQKLTPNIINKIETNFPEVDIVYIATGKGKLLKKSDPEIIAEMESVFELYEVLRIIAKHESMLKDYGARISYLEKSRSS